MKKLLGEPRAANVIALVALFVALGGTSYAAITLPKNSVGSKQIKRHAVTLSKISTSARKSLRGKTGATGATGLTGAKGDPGTPGTALAFARVTGAGVVDPAQSLNLATANVAKTATAGIYCFIGLTFTPHNAMVTLQEPFPNGETLGLAARVVVGTPDPAFSCPAGTTALVTIRKDAGGVEDHPFYILFN